jgi:hypothetical protein
VIVIRLTGDVYETAQLVSRPLPVQLTNP